MDLVSQINAPKQIVFRVQDGFEAYSTGLEPHHMYIFESTHVRVPCEMDLLTAAPLCADLLL